MAPVPHTQKKNSQPLLNQTGSVFSLAFHHRIRGIKAAFEHPGTGNIEKQLAATVAFAAKHRTVGPDGHGVELVGAPRVIRAAVHGERADFLKSAFSRQVIGMQLAGSFRFPGDHEDGIVTVDAHCPGPAVDTRLAQYGNRVPPDIETHQVAVAGGAIEACRGNPCRTPPPRGSPMT